MPLIANEEMEGLTFARKVIDGLLTWVQRSSANLTQQQESHSNSGQRSPLPFPTTLFTSSSSRSGEVLAGQVEKLGVTFANKQKADLDHALSNLATSEEADVLTATTTHVLHPPPSSPLLSVLWSL